MCGIAGFIDFKKESDQPLLEKMTGCIAYRGPDGQGDEQGREAGGAG